MVSVEARVSGTTTTTAGSRAQVVCGAGKTLGVYVKVCFKGTSTTAAHIRTTLLRGLVTTGGVAGSAATLSKLNTLENITPTTTVTAWSTPPTAYTSTTGELDCHSIHPQSSWSFKGVQLNPAETLDVVFEDATTTLFDIVYTITEA